LTDRVACINLLDREDRYEIAKQRFAAVGLNDDKVKFYRVHRHPKGSSYGAMDSHRQIIKDAYNDKSVETVLIFEDDVIFHEGWEKVVSDAKKFIDSGIPFDALYLSCFMNYVKEETTPEVWRVKCYMCHAYIISRQGMEKFMEHLDLFEEKCLDNCQDYVYNAIWQDMYAIRDSDVVSQDGALGTDNHWFHEIPPQYGSWFQTVVIPRFVGWIQPLVRSSWWYRTPWGSHYMPGMDDRVMDDGEVVVKGLWIVDWMVLAVVLFTCQPPFGYLTLVRDMIQTVWSVGKARWKKGTRGKLKVW